MDPGREIMKRFEEFAEFDLSGYGIEISEICSSVLRALGLAKGVEIAEGEGLKIEISDVSVDFCDGECRLIQCPICSSVLLAVAKATGELIAVFPTQASKYVVQSIGLKIPLGYDCSFSNPTEL